ncbi:aldo/keto reductase [Heliobacterium chlorum]|uniref:Aldo/keto reductase n=1 Tax=Heliobacterium chlorum TaxID=2698 RepID=A0ABR7T4U4_HELCL|nr:aldo/keto reductase [Heliobacterium chlorum]MBC9784581.1 aldo/keto reductase [Heliobacterium chlorum]
MLYRALGNTGVNVSILGFGCMRLPVLNGKSHQIDEEKAAEILHYAIDHGVNYVDTAYPYHSEIPFQAGMSEIFLGKALKNGYREKVHLATKLPSWLIKTREDMDRYLNEQLTRLQTDHIDFYLIHSLNQALWPNLKQLGVLEFLDSALADGRIRHAGFSFHDEYPLFKEIVDAYNWSFCQIQYNFMDIHYQAGRKGLMYAAEKGLGVVVMEPLRGGKLVNRIPADIQQIWDQAETKRSPVEWAFQFLWNHPQVNVVLSGMTEMQHVIDNLKAAEKGYPNSLTEQELELFTAVKKMYESKIKVNCTNCNYCMPCPAGVHIPRNFSQLNNASIYDDVAGAKMAYHTFMPKHLRASNCTDCGQCETLCPQNIPIRSVLKEVDRTFA